MISGYNSLPGKRFYSDSSEDKKHCLARNALRRNEFTNILQLINCADNNNPNLSNKMWKQRPLMDKLKNNFLKYFVPFPHMGFDESMISYCGEHSYKQCVRGKLLTGGITGASIQNAWDSWANFSMTKQKLQSYSSKGKGSSPVLLEGIR